MIFNEQRPIYLQIAQLIGSYILSGEWAEGARIPSVREFGITLGVNPATILRAYDELSRLEIVEQRRGVGYFVTIGAAKSVRRARKEEFLSETLPGFFADMDSLSITIEEVVDHYNSR